MFFLCASHIPDLRSPTHPLPLAGEGQGVCCAFLIVVAAISVASRVRMLFSFLYWSLEVYINTAHERDAGHGVTYINFVTLGQQVLAA